MALKYGISAIGWYNFELLVQTLLKAVIGPGVSSFGGTRDGGRDATFRGRANFPSETENWDGHWIFQVKHIDFEERGVRVARNALVGSVAEEMGGILSRGQRRRHMRNCDNYILITNVPLTAGNRDDLVEKAREANHAGNFHTIDGKEVCQFLDVYPQLRRSYPQLLALADLEVIVNRELYNRSEAYLQNWQPRLVTFVRTQAYREALEILGANNFLVLDGPPEAGKSTIAAAIALFHCSIGFEVLDIKGPDDFFKMYDRERKQLFVADDAVGAIAFVPILAENWSKDLSAVLRKLDGQHALIWTARKYVLEEALAETRLGETIREFPGPHEVLVEVGKLSTLEKAAILYNHAKRANLPPDDRTFIRNRAKQIIHHPNFTPEKVRQLMEPAVLELAD